MLECTVELFKHMGIFKNTLEVHREAAHFLHNFLECSLKFPSAYITPQCIRARSLLKC